MAIMLRGGMGDGNLTRSTRPDRARVKANAAHEKVRAALDAQFDQEAWDEADAMKRKSEICLRKKTF